MVYLDSRPPRAFPPPMTQTAARSSAPRRSGSRPGSETGSLAFDASPLSLRYRARNLVEEAPRRRRSERLIRVLNVIVASVGILLTLPMMILVAIAVKVTSPGPIMFTQPRVGLDRRRNHDLDDQHDRPHRRASDRGGKIFTIYKFRTMRPAKPGEKQKWASQSDARITIIGKFLRATRLDELPQFFNVLKGDMNIVGPRPEQPDIFSELEGELGRGYRRRQKVLPGITGLAQVNLGYDTDLDGVRKKVAMDLQYIGRRSPANDLQIMAKTVPVMVFRKVWM